MKRNQAKGTTGYTIAAPIPAAHHDAVWAWLKDAPPGHFLEGAPTRETFAAYLEGLGATTWASMRERWLGSSDPLQAPKESIRWLAAQGILILVANIDPWIPFCKKPFIEKPVEVLSRDLFKCFSQVVSLHC